MINHEQTPTLSIAAVAAVDAVAAATAAAASVTGEREYGEPVPSQNLSTLSARFARTELLSPATNPSLEGRSACPSQQVSVADGGGLQKRKTNFGTRSQKPGTERTAVWTSVPDFQNSPNFSGTTRPDSRKNNNTNDNNNNEQQQQRKNKHYDGKCFVGPHTPAAVVRSVQKTQKTKKHSQRRKKNETDNYVTNNTCCNAITSEIISNQVKFNSPDTFCSGQTESIVKRCSDNRKENGSSITETNSFGKANHQSNFISDQRQSQWKGENLPDTCLEDTFQGLDSNRTFNNINHQFDDSGNFLRFPLREPSVDQYSFLCQDRAENINQFGHYAASSGVSERLFQDSTTFSAIGVFDSAPGGASIKGSNSTGDDIQTRDINSVEENNFLRLDFSTSEQINQPRKRGRPPGSSKSFATSLGSASQSVPPLLPLTALIWNLDLLRSILQCDGIYTYKSIPKPLRPKVVSLISKHMRQILTQPDSLTGWIELFILPRAILQCLPSGHHAYRLRSRKRQKIERDFLMKNIADWEFGQAQRDTLVHSLLQLQITSSSGHSNSVSEATNIRRCSRIAREDGQYGKAIKALQSYGVAPACSDTTEQLRTKHPQNVPLPIPPPRDISHVKFDLEISTDEVLNALQSFPKGTGCGRTGLRVSHLLDMYGGENKQFLQLLTDFIQLMAMGKAPIQFAPFLSSAPLVPLLKKNGSIRPIAVGEVFRRITSKIMVMKVRERALDILKPLQVGVGVPNGTEAVLNGLNRLIGDPSLPTSTTITSVDFENAFNNVDRQSFLNSIEEFFPELSPWVQYTYCCSALLFLPGGDIIEAVTGVQQGDPLGPLLFSLAIHPLLIRLQGINTGFQGPFSRPFISAYLDDVQLVTPTIESAILCLKEIDTMGPAMGLFRSHEKSFVWQPHSETLQNSTEIMEQVQSLAQIHLGVGIEMLGGCISLDTNFVSNLAVSRATKVASSIETLMKLQDPQLCLMLLRACLGMCKMIYCFRTSPPEALHAASSIITTSLHAALRYIVVAHGPFFGDFQFQLSSLPIRFSGLGITLPSDVVPYAFLTSQLATSSLQQDMFPVLPDSKMMITPLLESFIASLHPNNQPTCSLSDFLVQLLLLKKPHNFLAELYFRSKRYYLLEHEYLKSERCQPFKTQHDLILQSTSYDHRTQKDQRTVLFTSLSSQWLLALPNTMLGQTMDPMEYRAALAFRLLIPLRPSEVPCPADRCHSSMDPFGYHALSCGGIGSQRHSRHEILVRALCDFAQVAGFHPVMNAKVQCLGEASTGVHYFRPADLLISGDNHQRSCVDVTIVSPLSMAKISHPDGKKLGHIVVEAAAAKIRKHEAACALAGKGFIPFAADVCGLIDKVAFNLLNRLASSYAALQSKPYSYGLEICKRRLSFAIQLGIARQLIPQNLLSTPLESLWGSIL